MKKENKGTKDNERKYEVLPKEYRFPYYLKVYIVGL